jgi:predicted glycogen debranching enzyme
MDARRAQEFTMSGREWLEADGLGGYACGTDDGIRTRRYHALLCVATTPPTGRMVLVNGIEAWLETPTGPVFLSSHRYVPDVVAPDGARRIVAFTPEPWPTWTYALPGDRRVEHGVVVEPGRAAAGLYWRLCAGPPAVLAVRLLCSGRDHHALHRENPRFRFAAAVTSGRITIQTYPGLPAIVARTNGTYTHEPEWYRRFLYTEERARGLDCTEDLASPGVLRWDLGAAEATCVLAAEGHEPAGDLAALRMRERRRRAAFSSALARAADAYVVRRGTGRTIIAGYPWFTDWGRDTFVALRGLCLAADRLDDARAILRTWTGVLSAGMLPNCFPDRGEPVEYNAVDAPLWFVVAVGEVVAAAPDLPSGERRALVEAVEAILAAYAAGTRYGIRADGDGLLAAGVPGVQLTWMDARVDGQPVTPRIGKPVEVEALWLNALAVGGRSTPRWQELAARGRVAFAARFWNDARGWLYDVVDVDHRPGTADPTLRPNQIFAVGGLPECLLDEARARRVVDVVEARLQTPLGLRSLAPGEPGYAPRYVGGPRERDAAYHQGTVWPWLLGPFVEAWVRVRGATPEVRRAARQRFLAPLLTHLDDAGIGHLPEVADAEPPHTPRGSPFQAWSVGEALRLARLLADEQPPAPPG